MTHYVNLDLNSNESNRVRIVYQRRNGSISAEFAIESTRPSPLGMVCYEGWLDER